MKTAELTGAALDWAVAKLERRNPVLVGGRVMRMPQSKFHTPRWLSYSTSWEQGGPIIEKVKIELYRYAGYWGAHAPGGYGQEGPTPLIAAMRCYVASKLGDEVDVPGELV